MLTLTVSSCSKNEEPTKKINYEQIILSDTKEHRSNFKLFTLRDFYPFLDHFMCLGE